MKRYVKPRQYAIYFQWRSEPKPEDDYSPYWEYEGTEDSIIVETAAERDFNIRDMIRRDDFQYIAWCQIYSNGEYGPDHEVLDERAH